MKCRTLKRENDEWLDDDYDLRPKYKKDTTFPVSNYTATIPIIYTTPTNYNNKINIGYDFDGVLHRSMNKNTIGEFVTIPSVRYSPYLLFNILI